MAVCPMSVCFDPLRTCWPRRWQRQVDNRDGLPLLSAATNGNDLFGRREVDALDDHSHAQHTRFKREAKLLLQHAQEPRAPFGLAVRIDGGFLHEPFQVGPARRPLATAWGSPAPLLSGSETH